jgi:methyl halide transferase
MNLSARDRFGRSERLSPRAWDERYRTGETRWDLGRVAPPLARKVANESPAGKRILVPGCGRGHEARHLAAAGAKEVVAVDVSGLALEEARRLEPAVSKNVRWVQGDVRQLPEEARGPFDWVVEHTCFCALAPEDRSRYLEGLRDVMSENGRLIGLFFVDFDNPDGPPFGIFQKDLRRLMEEKFRVLEWESHPADSVPERREKEALVVAEPKK